MNFEDLKHREKIFIDANIFIYHFLSQSSECKELLLKCARKELIGYTLTSILAEVLHRLMIAEAIEKGHINSKNPVKKLNEKPEIIKQLSIYIKNVEKINEMNITIEPLTNELIKSSAKIRKEEGLLTNDSLVVASMKDLGLSNLVTSDSDFEHINFLKVYKPTDI